MISIFLKIRRASAVDGLFKSTKIRIVPLGFRILMNHACSLGERYFFNADDRDRLKGIDSTKLFKHTRMQLGHHRFSSIARDGVILPSCWGCPQSVNDESRLGSTGTYALAQRMAPHSSTNNHLVVELRLVP